MYFILEHSGTCEVHLHSQIESCCIFSEPHVVFNHDSLRIPHGRFGDEHCVGVFPVTVTRHFPRCTASITSQTVSGARPQHTQERTLRFIQGFMTLDTKEKLPVH